MSLTAGDRLGPYEINGPLGAGGMGEVYRATDTRLDRSVAVKVLTQQVAANPEARERFEREARAVAALSHPHICTLHDIGSQNGTDYLVMELLGGESLAARPSAEISQWPPGLVRGRTHDGRRRSAHAGRTGSLRHSPARSAGESRYRRTAARRPAGQGTARSSSTETARR